MVTKKSRLGRILEAPTVIELAELAGPAWADVWVRGRWLFLPGWRAGLEVGELRALWWASQEARRLRHELERVSRELEQAGEALAQLETRCDWYRRQVRLEARLGMMLGRVAA